MKPARTESVASQELDPGHETVSRQNCSDPSGTESLMSHNELFLGMLLITLLSYLRCLGNPFVFEDRDSISMSWSFLWKSWLGEPLNHIQSSYYRPVAESGSGSTTICLASIRLDGTSRWWRCTCWPCG